MSSALSAGLGYFKNPLSVLQAARDAAKLRLTVPLDLVRWGLGKIRSKAVGEFSVAAEPPGIRLGLVATVMGNQLRVGAVVNVEQIELGPDMLRLTIRVNGLAVEPQGMVAGPISALLSSGAIDLSKPGNLMGFLPKKPAMIAEAKDDRFVLDLLQIASLRDNLRVQKILSMLTPVVTIRDLVTSGDALLVGLRFHPSGLPLLLAALRG
jgi:hypothetical protein